MDLLPGIGKRVFIVLLVQTIDQADFTTICFNLLGSESSLLLTESLKKNYYD